MCWLSALTLPDNWTQQHDALMLSHSPCYLLRIIASRKMALSLV